MKVVLKVFLITLVGSAFGLMGCNYNSVPRDVKSSSSSLIVEKYTIDESITILLPQVVVELNEGKQRIGWLTQFNSQKKDIQITWNGNYQKIVFKNIKKIKFLVEKAPYSSAKVLARNEKKIADIKQENWVAIPTKDFQLQKNRTDEAKVKLSNSILASSKQLILGSSYIIESMEFDDSLQKMNLKVFLAI